MIPTAYLQAWSAKAPWPDLRQVEQDLIISRALCDLFNAPAYTEKLCLAVPTRLRPRSVRRRSVQFAQLRRYPLALPTAGHGLRTLVDRIAAERNVALDVHFELDSVQLLRDVVVRNLACIILRAGSSQQSGARHRF